MCWVLPEVHTDLESSSTFCGSFVNATNKDDYFNELEIVHIKFSNLSRQINIKHNLRCSVVHIYGGADFMAMFILFILL